MKKHLRGKSGKPTAHGRKVIARRRTMDAIQKASRRRNRR